MCSLIVPGRAVLAQIAVKQLFSSFRGLKAQGLSRDQTLRRDKGLDWRHSGLSVAANVSSPNIVRGHRFECCRHCATYDTGGNRTEKQKIRKRYHAGGQEDQLQNLLRWFISIGNMRESLEKTD